MCLFSCPHYPFISNHIIPIIMTEYEKMQQDGYSQSYRDKDIQTQKDKQDLLTHPDDKNFVKPLSGGDWERYDSDKHNK